MTEQYRDGSDDEFFLTSSQHTAMKRISFLNPPFPITNFQYYCSLKKRKKERKKNSFPYLLNPIQPSPIRSPNIII